MINDNKEILINGSTNSVAFVNEKLEGYEILGCWVAYQDDDIIICKKNKQYYQIFVNKKDQTIGELTHLSTKTIKGQNAYYELGDPHHEYMVIMPDGLYIFNETEEFGEKPTIWSNDPTWNPKN